MKSKRGGKRRGSGRKHEPDKKIQVCFYIRKSIIDAKGGIENFKTFYEELMNKQIIDNDQLH